MREGAAKNSAGPSDLRDEVTTFGDLTDYRPTYTYQVISGVKSNRRYGIIMVNR